MKLGSLFDGSGGFPLSGSLCGITPAWAAEVEPYPIAVTTSRFPSMKHLGSVTDINGAEVDPVDIITFGSPCQDLSVAGKRAGLKHEANGDEETTRSGLFMEAVRIIKEMRRATNGLHPTFAIWENVPGAFSSNGGEDFRVVLEELIKIVEPGASVPSPDKGKWPYSDAYVGDGWSLAYRTLDAQYWGVPQRRRRIYLVVDFRGERAHKVLFERKGLRGYFETGRAPWQGTPCHAENCPGAADREGAGDCLTPPPIAYSFDSLASNSMKSCNPHSGCRVVQIAKTLDTTDPNPTKNQGGIAILEPIAVATQQGGAEISQNGICPTVTAAAGMSGNNQPWIAFAQNQRDEVRLLGDKAGSLQAQPGMKQQTFIIDSIGGQAERGWEGEVAPTLKATHYKCPPCVMEAAGFKAGNGAKANGIGWEKEISPTFSAAPSGTNQVPSVCIRCFDARGNGDGKTVPTLTGDHENRVTDYTAVCVEPVPIHDQPVYCLQGNGIDRADTAGCNGAGWREGQSYTLNTIDRPAVAYATDVGFFNSQENVSPTLLARSYKDPHLVSYPEDKIHYIVRRLTPTECARLQGFPDRWGDINPKEDLTDEEYRFWLNVRNTHAAINGKTTKEYTKPQMLTWYSKLHTDSAEYKMWGNGIALPTALYVLQGIAEVSGL